MPAGYVVAENRRLKLSEQEQLAKQRKAMSAYLSTRRVLLSTQNRLITLKFSKVAISNNYQVDKQTDDERLQKHCQRHNVGLGIDSLN